MNRPSGPPGLWIVPIICLLAGCTPVAPPGSIATPKGSVQRTYTLRHMDYEHVEAALKTLDLPRAERVERSGFEIRVTGAPDQLKKVDLVLDVMDSAEEYCIESLGPATIAKTLLSRGQILAALGDIAIGTFDEPPAVGASVRALLDVRADSVLMIMPARCRDRLLAVLAGDHRPGSRPKDVSDGVLSPVASASGMADENEFAARPTGQSLEASASAEQGPQASDMAVTLARMSEAKDAMTVDEVAEQPPVGMDTDTQPAKTTRITFTPASHPLETSCVKMATDRATPGNGEDILSMALPETITLIQLLDLVGKHVGLNYVYDPREIGDQPISLKLYGELRGEMKVKDLYAVLETVLDFMDLAMIRQKDNLVAIVPMEKALQTQPELVDGRTDAVQVGDTVVTRVFDIRYVDAASAMALLQNLKLSVSATCLDNTNRLLVTCHTGRMNRIERLIEMIDQPGQSIECRFRRLIYVRATPLIAKIRSLAGELQGPAVAMLSSPAKSSLAAAAPGAAARASAAPRPAVAEDVSKGTVYLDGDERTNRILMIGLGEDLTQVEQLIDVLDIAQDDPRSPRVYTLKHVNAQQAVDKLQTLEVLGDSSGADVPADKGGIGTSLTGEPLVAVLEATNQLVVQATPDQHRRIRDLLNYIDVISEDTRTIVAYRIQHMDVHVAKTTLEELDLVDTQATEASSFVDRNESPAREGPVVPVSLPAGNPLRKAPLVVSESSNSLLVKATPEQHARIAKIIRYIDRPAPGEEWVYQVYPLESSSPDHLARLLERLIEQTTIEQTTADADKKVERISPKTPERIAIVPDPNTFSLIVYASQRSQKWIEGLIARLDKRRPQVLIDVTLVEISRTDTFEYDLSLVASDSPVIGNLVVDPIQSVDSSSRLEGGFNVLDDDGNPTGKTRAFYNDKHVQALLTAMQQKNYGRVLAKPRVLVDDGREGQILTTDTTTYVKESIQIPQTGTPITTREFVPIEASIKLKITPHISEGNLLRLDVYMSRDDFGSRPLSGSPPDKVTSEVTTTVFVPDDRTVILGGLVRLNQSKGGSKVPILGDIPLIGLAFRSIGNSDMEKKLYVFLKANIVRPYDGLGLADLQEISTKHREAFEQSEAEFQEYQSVPGITPEPMPPESVLQDYE
ncbi:MAG: secretin N-terminal domain-containing protein [Solirubrobacterales bacterium]